MSPFGGIIQPSIRSESSQNNFAVRDGNFETSWQLIKILLGINRIETKTYCHSRFIFNFQDLKYFIDVHKCIKFILKDYVILVFEMFVLHIEDILLT